MNKKHVTMGKYGMLLASLIVVGVVLASTCVADDGPANATTQRGSSWANECERLREKLRKLDAELELRRAEMSQISTWIGETNQTIRAKEKRQAAWRSALCSGRDLLVADSCNVKVGDKTYSKAEFAVGIKQLLQDYQAAAKELKELQQRVTERQCAYEKARDGLTSGLATRVAWVAELERHASANSTAEAAPASAPAAERQPISDVIAEVDKLLANEK